MSLLTRLPRSGQVQAAVEKCNHKFQDKMHFCLVCQAAPCPLTLLFVGWVNKLIPVPFTTLYSLAISPHWLGSGGPRWSGIMYIVTT